MKKILSILLLISILLSSFTFTALAAEEIMITTADELCKMDTGYHCIPVHICMDCSVPDLSDRYNDGLLIKV